MTWVIDPGSRVITIKADFHMLNRKELKMAKSRVVETAHQSQQSTTQSSGGPGGRSNAAIQDQLNDRQASDVMNQATSGSGGGIPHQGLMEKAFGSDLSWISAHTGQDEAMGMIGANAAASDGSVAFAEDNPSTKTVAEEVAHALRGDGGGGGTGVSSPGSAQETEASKIASTVASGDKAPAFSAPAGGAGIYREDTSQVGGDYAQGVNMASQDGRSLNPGATGFSRAMLESTPACAELEMSRYQELMLTHVTPNTSIIDNQMESRAASAEHWRGWRDGENSVFGIPEGSMPWEVYEGHRAWCEGQVSALAVQKETEISNFQTYNSWVPRANQGWTCMARLQAQMNICGITSIDDMIESLEGGLEDAQSVAASYNRERDNGASLESLPAPEANEDVGTASRGRHQQTQRHEYGLQHLPPGLPDPRRGRCGQRRGR